MRRIATIFVSSLFVSAAASADMVTVTIENLQSQGGFSFTPVWLGFHDGSFNTFDPNQAASLFPGVQDAAELGATGSLADRFNLSSPTGFQTTVTEMNGAPVFSPGESRSIGFDLDPNDNAYLNFMSMVVPSNDLFIGNAMAIQLFESGAFTGPVTIEIYGSMVWDAGTEVNNITDGGAFVTGVDALGGTDENGVVHLLYSDAGAQGYLDSIIGTTTADGGSITQSFTPETLIGRITIVPAPGAAVIFAASLLLTGGRRRLGRSL